MSYTNGISAGQQLPELNESTAASSANRAESASLASHQTKAADQATQVDQAVVSSTATGIAQALSGSDVRMDKVSALQQSIAAGTYAVPSADVADKLMSELLQ